MSTIPKELATPEYFYSELSAFREVMGSTAFTPEQKADALYGLSFVAAAAADNTATPANERARIERAFITVGHEWDRRLKYELLRPFYVPKDRPAPIPGQCRCGATDHVSCYAGSMVLECREAPHYER